MKLASRRIIILLPVANRISNAFYALVLLVIGYWQSIKNSMKQETDSSFKSTLFLASPNEIERNEKNKSIIYEKISNEVNESNELVLVK
jgi:hypothetical protein